MIAGIDYGSKTAGTTVVAWAEGEKIYFAQSEKNKDADLFLTQFIATKHFHLIALDAPLSLPAKLISRTSDGDYFYRKADKELRAMSPMFLGGLTARAMKLRDDLARAVNTIVEAYPKAFVQLLQYRPLYQKKNLSHLPQFYQELQAEFSDYQYPKVRNWHQVDAIIAFLIADKYQKGIHSSAGDSKEGLIIY